MTVQNYIYGGWPKQPTAILVEFAPGLPSNCVWVCFGAVGGV